METFSFTTYLVLSRKEMRNPTVADQKSRPLVPAVCLSIPCYGRIYPYTAGPLIFHSTLEIGQRLQRGKGVSSLSK
jgi:hypothetical protein